MSGIKTCSAEGGAGTQTQGCSRTVAYAKPLGKENLLPVIFISRLLVLCPTSLGRWRLGMSKSLKSNSFLSADVISPNQCCASKSFVKTTLMPIPGCSFNTCSFCLAHKRQLVILGLREPICMWAQSQIPCIPSNSSLHYNSIPEPLLLKLT